MVTYALVALLGLIALGVHVAATLGFLSISLTEIFSSAPLMRAAGQIAWTVSTDFVLVAIPMFILMGEFMLQSGMARDMFRALDRWLGWLPGGLMHSNVASCALFGSVAGSSVATAATIGTIAIPNIAQGRYNERLFLGTLAAGGTLGILIPPSINAIIYGVLAETSVSRLYLACTIPGGLLALLFTGYVLIACILRPEWGGARTKFNFSAELIRELFHLLPPLILLFAVIGVIFIGVATPTEAAAFGVIGAMLFAVARRQFSMKLLLDSCAATMRMTGLMMVIVLAAFVLNFVMVSTGLTRAVTGVIESLGWGPLGTMLAIIAFYLVLGCFMETVSMMIATAPIIVPVVVALGYDKVWFGVVFIILIEVALITPPIGLNLFVIQGVRGRGAINDVIMGSLPFVIVMMLMIGLLLAYPQLALWLPDAVMGER
jgi:tripartite ATP-independent transporter DctM subunit